MFENVNCFLDAMRLKMFSISKVLTIENNYIYYGQKQTRNEMDKTSLPYLTELLAPDMLIYCSSKNGWKQKDNQFENFFKHLLNYHDITFNEKYKIGHCDAIISNEIS